MTSSPFRSRIGASRRARPATTELLALVSTWRLALSRRLRMTGDRLLALRPAALALRPGGRTVMVPMPKILGEPGEQLIDAARRALDSSRQLARRTAASVRPAALAARAALRRSAGRIEDPAQAWLAAGALAAAAVVTILGVVAAQVASPVRAATLAHATTEALLGGSGTAASAGTEASVPVPSGVPGSLARVPAAAPIDSSGPLLPQVEPQPVLPTDRGALPLGKGMWLYETDKIEGGSVDGLVARAKAVGLDHVYVRTGSSRMGFYAAPYLDQLLPKAHAAGIRVYGWDFPYLHDPGADVDRVIAAIMHTAPGGHRLDGFAPDIETPSEGTNLTGASAQAFSEGLRARVGPAYPLIAVVPRPSEKMQQRFPYHAVLGPYDAVAPMTYWLNRQPDTDVAQDVTWLSQFGKPVIPIGQAYDGAPEGGRPGPPPPDEIRRFLASAEHHGAVGASFWSWQHANEPIWAAIKDAPEFRWEAKAPEELRPAQIRALQAQLNRLGFPVGASGVFDAATEEALRAYQTKARLKESGRLDDPTLAFLRAPFNPPVGG